MSEPDPAASAELPFETALARLEKLVDELDRGELELEGALARFEEGVRLVRLCSERLADARVRVRKLELTPQGLALRPLEVEDAS